MSERPASQSFGARFLVVPLEQEGVLIDVSSGSYFRLDALAAQICAVMERSPSPSEAASELAALLRVPEAETTKMIARVETQLQEVPRRVAPAGPFRYRPAPSGYALEHDSQTVLEIDGAGRKLSLKVPVETLSFQIRDYVRAITPKVLHLQGVTVLHASACELPHGLTAFSGRSGAGKTTMARSFDVAGCPMIAEDLVVVSPGRRDGRTNVVIQGERQAHDWADRTAAILVKAPHDPVDCRAVADAAQSGDTRPLAEVWFLDADRREGSAIQRTRLEPVSATLALLANHFLATEGRESWYRHVRESEQIARTITAWEVVGPEGLDQLSNAVRAYATNRAS